MSPGFSKSVPRAAAVAAISILCSSGARAQVLRDTRFNVKRGFHDKPFSLEIRADDASAVIRFTTDGSAPSRTHGRIYTSKLTIDTTTVVRAIAYTPIDQTNVDTQTYLFLESILRQSGIPAGYPEQWGGLTADYDMDPDVVRDTRYRELLRPALTQIPTVSVVMDVRDLFDGGKGIYQFPLPGGREWERPASVELIDPRECESFQADCAIRIHGGDSRDPINSPKHSFRLLFKSPYGDTKLRYPLFGPDAAKSFDTVVLRAGFSNTWIHHNMAFNKEDQRAQADYIRDQWTRDLEGAMGRVAVHGRYVHLYLNGLYWGIYNLVERPDASFAATYFGGDKEDYDVFDGEEVIDGDRRAWDALVALANRGLSTQAEYEEIQKYVDVQNLADYMILNHVVGNHDWDTRNWYASRKRGPSSQFRFFTWDSEHVAERARLRENRVVVDNNGSPSRIFQRLRENAEFRVLFGDRVQKLLLGNGVLSSPSLDAHWMARAQEIELAIIAEAARWGDYRRDVQPRGSPLDLYGRNTHWIPEIEGVRRDFFPTRTSIVLEQYRAALLYPLIDAPTFSQNGGRVPRDFKLEIAGAGSGTIFYTLDGTDPRESGGAVSPSAQAYTAPVPLAREVTVRARAKEGYDWSARNEASFAFLNDFTKLVINEVMYHPDGAPAKADRLEFIELVNTGDETLDLTGVSFTSGIELVISGGTLAPGGFFVLASNSAAFLGRYGFRPNAVYSGGLSNESALLQIEDKTGLVLDKVTYRDVAPWPLAPDGGGSSLELLDSTLDNNDPASWSSSSLMGGTPGARNSVARLRSRDRE